MNLCKPAALLLILLSAVSGIAQANRGPALKNIKDTITEAGSEKTVGARTNAAEHLARLTKQIGSKEITNALVIDIMSLLNSPDDSVRYWVARALGNLGPAAKAAVPKLEELLPKADCISGTKTSASGIRY